MIYILLLLISEIMLFLKNYVPSTYLIGWDNIMPEFNIFLNLERNLNGVWQTYRGLGLYDGMAHTANLIHTILIGLLSLFLPLNIIRYVAIILLHLTGGIGMLKLLERLKINKKISFLGALFYMFNLGTIQQFFAPLETFAFHFAALPWLFWAGIGFLEKKDKRSLLLFFLTSIIFTPQFFVPTFFIVYTLALSSLLVWDLLNNKTIKNFFIIFLITLVINSFWLIPYIYGLPQNASIIQNARINQFSSENVYLRNKARGNLINVLKLKGFMMDTIEYDSLNNKNIKFMEVWEKYSESFIYKLIWFTLLTITTIGIIKSFNKKRQVVFFLPLIISFFALSTNTLILADVHELIRYNFPIIAEVFRFPFTKFITLEVFSLTIFFALGLKELTNFIKKEVIVFLPVLVMIAVLSYPAFQGNFFSFLLKRKIPVDYFKVFQYFKNQKEDERIALLPTHTFWSWQYRKWGHVGSGFLWYGIPQPIMERAFDPWSHFNEQYFNEISYAINRNNLNLFNYVIEKYNIGYILLDQYLINNLNSKPINYEKLISFLDSNPKLKKEFTVGKIIIYKSINNLQNQKIINSPIRTNDYAKFYYYDPAYPQISNYIIDQKNPDIIFPFANLFTEKLQTDRDFEVEKVKNFFILKPKKNLFQSISSPQTYQINWPDLTNSQLVPIKLIKEKDNLIIELIYPDIFLNGNKLIFPKQSIILQLQQQHPVKEFYLTETDQLFHENEIAYLFQHYPNTLRITYTNDQTELKNIDINKFSKHSYKSQVSITQQTKLELHIPISNIFTINQTVDNQLWQIKENRQEINFYYPKLPYQTGYLILVNASWKKGLAASFYINNPFTHRAELDAKIAKKNNYQNVFILPPNQAIGEGYDFHFWQENFGKIISQTDILNFEAYAFPYEFITNISLEKKNRVLNIDRYQVLFQSFHPGWQAYYVEKDNFLTTYFPFFFGKRLKDHVLVNNWANGWKISQELVKNSQSQLKIVIVFLPQYLEFIGFFLLIVCFAGIIFAPIFDIEST